MSPLAKLLEARLLDKHQHYLVNTLTKSQIGFVPQMDVFVNICRALKKIRTRIEAKSPVFCLFLDFRSAYNTVPHDSLFEKLSQVCSQEEIQLIRAIYSRLVIRLGNETLRCNTGVAQGSMISPALFDIYAEDLLIEMLRNGWTLDELFAFADDHLFICDSIDLVRKAIKIIRVWCINSNITLNESKSGVLEIVPHRKKLSLAPGTSIDGIPVVNSYRYLGLIIDNKLTGDSHIAYLNSKISFLNIRLAPLLSKVTVDYRINLWKALVRPLFNPLLALMADNNKTRILHTERILKGSLKNLLALFALPLTQSWRN